MNKEQKLVLSEAEGCDYCGEKLGPNPVRRGNRIYCSEACAFEAQRSTDCAGRSDTVMAPPIVERPEK
jgi:hypothetical protein